MFELSNLQSSFENKGSGQIYYSLEKKGFLVDGINKGIDKTKDIPLTEQEHRDLLDGNSKGMKIEYDPVTNKVVLVDPVPMSRSDLISSLDRVVQKYLDDFAKTRGYNSIESACSYKGSTNPTYNEEGTYCMQARDNVWQVFYSEIALLEQDDSLPVPSAEQLIAELPSLQWP